MEINVKYMEPTVNTKTHSEPRTCFGCLYCNHGYCIWFKIHRGERAKEIPIDVFEKGCNLREPSVENRKHDELTQKIIDTFNGEIREEQVVRWDRPRKKRWDSIYKRKRGQN